MAITPADLMSRLLYRFASPDHVRGIQRHYVELFRQAGVERVLDVGCGRGLFLELLREAGIEATGVDGSAEAVAECQRRGFPEVEQGEALAALQRLADRGSQLHGIFCSHLVEHLPGAEAVRLIALSASLLAPGGRLVIVTPNVANLEVWTRVFWLDPTHQRPYPRRLLAAIMEEAGLRVARSFDDPRTGQRYLGRDLYHLVPDLLRYGLSTFSGMDSVVVGDRAA
jgi:O-antigen chain-terminating methyltransferase